VLRNLILEKLLPLHDDERHLSNAQSKLLLQGPYIDDPSPLAGVIANRGVVPGSWVVEKIRAGDWLEGGPNYGPVYITEHIVFSAANLSHIARACSSEDGRPVIARAQRLENVARRLVGLAGVGSDGKRAISRKAQ
jgi:hypothetical protein